MLENKKKVNIVRGLKTIEWLKNQILNSVASVFVSLAEGCIESSINAIADIIISCYLLAKKLNINFCQLESVIEEKVRYSREHRHKMEQNYGDISELLYYLRSRQKE